MSRKSRNRKPQGGLTPNGYKQWPSSFIKERQPKGVSGVKYRFVKRYTGCRGTASRLMYWRWKKIYFHLDAVGIKYSERYKAERLKMGY